MKNDAAAFYIYNTICTNKKRATRLARLLYIVKNVNFTVKLPSLVWVPRWWQSFLHKSWHWSKARYVLDQKDVTVEWSAHVCVVRAHQMTCLGEFWIKLQIMQWKKWNEEQNVRHKYIVRRVRIWPRTLGLHSTSFDAVNKSRHSTNKPLNTVVEIVLPLNVFLFHVRAELDNLEKLGKEINKKKSQHRHGRP